MLLRRIKQRLVTGPHRMAMVGAMIWVASAWLPIGYWVVVLFVSCPSAARGEEYWMPVQSGIAFDAMLSSILALFLASIWQRMKEWVNGGEEKAGL